MLFIVDVSFVIFQSIVCFTIDRAELFERMLYLVYIYFDVSLLGILSLFYSNKTRVQKAIALFAR